MRDSASSYPDEVALVVDLDDLVSELPVDVGVALPEVIQLREELHDKVPIHIHNMVEHWPQNALHQPRKGHNTVRPARKHSWRRGTITR